MSEPLDFALRVLEREGALVESREDALEILVPTGLGERLGLPEHVLLAEDAESGARRVGYGTELLDRLVTVATERMPFASARVAQAGAREASAAQAIQSFVLRNGVFTAASPRPSAARRLVLHTVVTVEAEEKREGLVSAAVSIGAGTAVEGYEEAISPGLEVASAVGMGTLEAGRALRAALACCGARAELETASFRQGAERRFARDRERLSAYFEDLLVELSRRAAKGRLDAGSVADKREVLIRERAAKLEALAARQRIRLELKPVAALVVQSPAFLIPLELRRRKGSRQVEIEFDAVTRRLVPVACEGCTRSSLRLAACDERLHLLCETCAPEAGGRLRCGACQRKAA